jgi:hypothetical protein
LTERSDREEDHRLAGRETSSDRAQPGVAFKLMVRPFTTVGVDTRFPFTLFEDKLRLLIGDHTFDSRIRIVVITPTIIDATLAPPPQDYIKFKEEGRICLCWEGYRLPNLGFSISG